MMKDSDYIRHLKIIEQMANDVGKYVRTEIRNSKNKYVYDARVSTFFLIAQVVRWFKISLILKEECLNDPRWYKTRYLLKHEQQQPEIGYVPFKGEKGRGLMMPEINDYQLILIKEFKEVMRVAYSQVLYSIVESKLRLFLMTAYPDALEKRKKRDRRDIFSNVYKCLLEEAGKTQYEHLIWFFSLIRNTIHNNGKYWNKGMPCVCTKYKGTIFKFEHGKMVTLPDDAMKWLLLYITPDVIDMMEDIILNTKLKKIQSIPEPAAHP
jgi:hypothetical protein